MRDYVTVAEIGYAPHLLALHKSMIRYATDFRLTVTCVDRRLAQLLDVLNLPNVTVLDLSEPDQEPFADARATRSLGEYCWTLTPFLPEFVLRVHPDASVVTYIDADVWLMKSPEPVFREFLSSEAACFITPHAYAPDWDASAASGHYCVQFMPFRVERATPILKTWGDQCLERCSAVGGPGQLGDQGYLNDWPATYGPLVHIAQSPEWFQGPWNCQRFPYSEAIAYHFHGLRLASSHRVWLGTNPVPAPTLKNVYQPYLLDLRQAVDKVVSLGYPLTLRTHPMSRTRRIATHLSRLRRWERKFSPSRRARF